LDRLESRYKFGADLAAGRVLSTLWQREPCPVARPQCLLIVPLHRRRLRKRGYNQVSVTSPSPYATLTKAAFGA
jgi:predicted amidophosphoribosyltransferase